MAGTNGTYINHGTQSNLDKYNNFRDNDAEDDFKSPFDVSYNTHITIGVIVGVVVIVAVLVAIWCFKPCATRDRRMKNASTATSIASI